MITHVKAVTGTFLIVATPPMPFITSTRDPEMMYANNQTSKAHLIAIISGAASGQKESAGQKLAQRRATKDIIQIQQTG